MRFYISFGLNLCSLVYIGHLQYLSIWAATHSVAIVQCKAKSTAFKLCPMEHSPPQKCSKRSLNIWFKYHF